MEAIHTRKKQKNLKILMTLPFPALKTPLREHIPLLAGELKRQGWKVELFYYGRRREGCTRAGQASGLLFNLWNFLRCLGKKRIKIVQLNSAFDKRGLIRDLIFTLAARLSGKCVFVKFHGSADDLLYHMNFFWYAWAGLLFRLVQKIGLLSNKEAEDFSSFFSAYRAKLTVVKNPLAADYPARCRELRTKATQPVCSPHNGQASSLCLAALPKTKTTALAALPRNTHYITFASRLLQKKGLLDFIEAIPCLCARLSPQTVPVQFLVAGSGPDGKAARKRSEELQLTQHITWLDYLTSDQLQEILALTAIFVFPSHFPEGMPMALIQAMAAGAALITTRVRFAQSYLKEPDNCLFVEPGCPDRIADAMFHLLRNPEAQSIMRENNRLFLEAYLAPAVGREYIQIYSELLTRA